MKKPNFENDFYTEVYNYLVSLHGLRNVSYNEKINTIKVDLSNVRYFLIVSFNESKIYFQNNDPEASINLSYEDYKKLDKNFRVFHFNEAKKYIDFKNNENEFISSIAG